MSDLVAWLTAQLDDDERVADLAGVGCWHECDEADAALHEVFTPARVLGEVEAKRRILAEHQRHSDGKCVTCWAVYPCRTVRALALPYADREGYPAEWAPS